MNTSPVVVEHPDEAVECLSKRRWGQSAGTVREEVLSDVVGALCHSG